MDLIEKVKERLSVFRNFYDDIRVVDPLKKMVILNEHEGHGHIQKCKNSSCFALWEKDFFCENCISMRSYIKKDTFIKIEYDNEKIILVMAVPVEIEGNIYIVEILKDISKNGSIIHKKNIEFCEAGELISCMNKKTVTDKLTGTYNKKYIGERLPIDLNYCKINNLPLSIIMTEIDYLEDIKEEFGQGAGVKALIVFSNMIKKLIRSNTDWVGRYSARKFIIVLNDTEVGDAHIVAEKIRKQIEASSFNYKDANVSITSSFGVYGITDYNMNFSELLLKVHKNLHKASIGGNNRTISNQGEIYRGGFFKSAEKNFKLTKLDKQINELRDDLNEICATFEDDEVKSKKLIISQYLDELIVQYMKELNS